LQIADWSKIIIGALLTTFTWLFATFITPPDDQETLQNFVDKVNPGGPGWKRYPSRINAEPWIVPKGIFSMFLGCTAVYGFLLSTGQFIYGNIEIGFSLFSISVFSFYGIYKIWK